MVKEMKLNNSDLTCLVDDEDYEILVKYNWKINSINNYIRGCLFGKRQYLHRFLCALDFDHHLCADHINHNKLDNRKENLRVCTKKENSRNARKHKRKTLLTSKYKGISKHKNNTYVVKIVADDKSYHIGTFNNEIKAAEAYDFNAIKYYGEFACLNFPDKDYSNYIVESNIKKVGIFSSKFVGVSFSTEKNKWTAYMKINGKFKYIGTYDDEIEAAHHYDYHVILFNQNKKYLNFPNFDYTNYQIKKKEKEEQNEFIWTND